MTDDSPEMDSWRVTLAPMRTSGIALVAVLLLAGCGGDSLESADPAGYQACQSLAEAAKVEGDPLARIGGMLEAGKQAREATTEEIRQAVDQIGSEWLADEKQMAAACESSGAF